MDGVLILNKPSGPTSHDIVNIIRKQTGIKRVGHTGTLDPMAEGVLVLCIGKATRIAEYLTSSKKKYIAGIIFGKTTDTYDTQGFEISNNETLDLTENQLSETLEKYKGKILQTPPQTSAIKKDGIPMYKYARKGIEIEIEPREVEILSLSLLSFNQDKYSTAEIEVECSTGTYIRSLINDIGNDLGCGAVMSSLIRISVSNMTIENAVSLEQIDQNPDIIKNRIITMHDSLSDYESITVSDEDKTNLIHGREIRIENIEIGTDNEIKAVSENNEFVGMCIGYYNDGVLYLKPRKILIEL